MKKFIYLDNAATSYPKPDSVPSAIERFIRECGGNPGRAGHRLSIEAGKVIWNTREKISQLFNVKNPLNVIFTPNATVAINLALMGILSPGDHVITSAMEHNSVMRPLRYLESKGVIITRVPCDIEGKFNLESFENSFRKETKLVIVTHASNVTGTIMPVKEIGKIARNHETLFCVDSAQSAGSLEIDMENMNIDLLAFTGHKSLYGPQGTGGLCVSDRAIKNLKPLIYGGTGSGSSSDEQPDFPPDKFEAGTPNTPGLAGLSAGLDFIQSKGIKNIREIEKKLCSILINGLRDIPEIKITGPVNADERAAIVSFTVENKTCSEIAEQLEEKGGIICRAGLHCAPYAHRTIGTFPSGTVRISPGFFNTEDEIKKLVQILNEIVK